MADAWDQFPDAGGSAVVAEAPPADPWAAFPDESKPTADAFASFPDVQPSPAAPAEPQTAADLMSSRFSEEAKRSALKSGRIRIPTMSETGAIPAPAIEGLLRYGNPLGWAQVANEKIAPDALPTKIGAGVIGGASEALSGFTTPESLSALAIMPEAKVAQILLNLGFGAEAVINLPAQIKAYGATNDPEEKARIATGIAVSLGLPALGLAHAALKTGLTISEVTNQEGGAILDANKTTKDQTAGPQPQGPESQASQGAGPEDQGIASRDPGAAESGLGRDNASAQSGPQQTRAGNGPEPGGAPLDRPGRASAPAPEPTAGNAEGRDTLPAATSGVTETAPADVRPVAPDVVAAIDANKAIDAEQDPTHVALPAEGDAKTTGIAQRIHDIRFDEGKIGEIKPGEGVSAAEMVQRGRDLTAQGVDPVAVAATFAREGKISGDGLAVVRAEMERLSRETNKAEEAWRAKPDDPVAKLSYDVAWKHETEWAQKVVKPMQTEWHKAGMVQQGETDIDTGTFSGLRRAVQAERGRDVTPKESAQLEDMARLVQEATKREQVALKKLDSALKKQTHDRPVKTADELRAHFAERIRKLTPC